MHVDIFSVPELIISFDGNTQLDLLLFPGSISLAKNVLFLVVAAAAKKCMQ